VAELIFVRGHVACDIMPIKESEGSRKQENEEQKKKRIANGKSTAVAGTAIGAAYVVKKGLKNKTAK
jgi:hypothetical protein